MFKEGGLCGNSSLVFFETFVAWHVCCEFLSEESLCALARLCFLLLKIFKNSACACVP